MIALIVAQFKKKKNAIIVYEYSFNSEQFHTTTKRAFSA
jgi:hypothetical protein